LGFKKSLHAKGAVKETKGLFRGNTVTYGMNSCLVTWVCYARLHEYVRAWLRL